MGIADIADAEAGSSVRNKINSAWKQAIDINTQTDDYTLVLADAGKIIEMNKGTANTLTLPANASVAFPVNTRIDICQLGAGTTTIAAAVGVTIRSLSGNLDLAGQYGFASLYKRGTNEWVLGGSLA